MTHFPVSNIETFWWLPPLVAFVVSCLTATGGLSGAFLLLPFQVSILGFTGPAVTPTNLIFNIVAIPGGVYRYYQEKRMIWPLAGVIIAGTLPGMFLGAVIRISLLPDPGSFKPFVGFVLAYVGFRLVKDVMVKTEKTKSPPVISDLFTVSGTSLTLEHIRYEFKGTKYSASTPGILVLSFSVGIIGGAYGIGGGAIIAPFLVTVFGLPVYTVAGAALLSTFVSSIIGVLIYILIGHWLSSSGQTISPDWLLGSLFGIGGAAGIYIGARLQRFVPSRVIKILLAVCVLSIAITYVSSLFR